MFTEDQIDFILMPYLTGCDNCDKIQNSYDKDESYELNVLRLLYNIKIRNIKPSDFCANTNDFVYKGLNN